ncbi:50S ribosomal protein L15 [Bacteroidetes bacterium UKL13-3]|jgi:large subunit ribosomal protein L15|nr:50S ribosomal protein L15 [Bacteroidetes bacterium UKL13-3]HCP93688.1 50S ribosomal protein L15 [Bacteroidota bacterium]
MKLHTLKPAAGSIKREGKRVGRGEGSGKGGTAARGHKGAGSRSGTSTKRGFEGGQMPLYRRIPKFGFKNLNRVEYAGINLDKIQTLIEEKSLTSIDLSTFIENGLVSKKELVKVLGRGEIKAAVEVKAHAFSETAKKAIEAAGGSVVLVPTYKVKAENA